MVKITSVYEEEYKNKIKQISPHEHILDSRQFDQGYIYEILLNANLMKKEMGKQKDLIGKIVAMLFYEPSTRTRFSFESAAKRLGAETISTENAKEFSSAAKGETLEDSIRITSGYSDFIVIRHPEDDSSVRAAMVSDVPIINAGSGKSQHPTQALLDVYTIYDHFGRLENIKTCVVGDLLNGRTVRSLVYLLSKFRGNEFYFVAPKFLMPPKDLTDHIEEAGLNHTKTGSLLDALSWADVVYMTRTQLERMTDTEKEELKAYEKEYGRLAITPENIINMPEKSILLHPLPRVGEIDPRIDTDPRARYFEQAKNGLYVRMAILSTLNRHNGKS